MTLNTTPPFNYVGIENMIEPLPIELKIKSFTAKESKPGSVDTYTLVIDVTHAIDVDSDILITSLSPPDFKSIRFLPTISITYKIGNGLLKTPTSPTIETSRILISKFNPTNIVTVG